MTRARLGLVVGWPMADMRNPLHDIADLADELTDPRRNTERISDTDRTHRRRARRSWTTTMPSLLQQLEYAVEPGGSLLDGDDGPGATSFESQPAARLEAISELQRIRAEVKGWHTYAAITNRHTLPANVRALVGAAALMNSTDQTRLCRDLQRWRNAAATITGWEQPPVAPRNATCPACSARNTIRVRLDQNVGMCTACPATWDRDNVGLLAEHIRLAGARETKDARALRTAAVALRRAGDAARAIHNRPPDLPDYRTVKARGW